VGQAGHPRRSNRQSFSPSTSLQFHACLLGESLALPCSFRSITSLHVKDVSITSSPSLLLHEMTSKDREEWSVEVFDPWLIFFKSGTLQFVLKTELFRALVECLTKGHYLHFPACPASGRWFITLFNFFAPKSVLVSQSEPQT
jgi:hypothetical protein